MPWGLAAAAGIGAGGSIISGSIGANAAKSAASTQAAAADRATQAELDMYNQNVAREQPFVQGGTNALAQLQQLLGIGGPGSSGTASSPILQMLGIGGPGGTGAGNINPATFQGSPGYQYALQQGENAVTNAAAQNGGIGGNALRELQNRGQGLANQNWNQYLGQASGAWGDLLSRLQSLISGGQGAAANLGSTGTTVGGQVGSNLIGAGNALAGGQIGSANAVAGGLNGAINNSLPYLLSNGGAGPTGLGTSLYNGITSLNTYGNTGGAGTNFLQQTGFFNPLSG